MNVQDIMTKDPACCTPQTNLRDVAQMMEECDCGAIPVVESNDRKNLVGMVTDRDITLRAVSQGKNPLTMSAGDIMSSPVVSARAEDDLQTVARMMEDNQVRRVPVVDQNNRILGILAQADLALQGSDELTGEVVERVSRPASSPSDV